MDLEFGDVVFIRVDNFLFRRVAESTRTWTSHVGIISGKENGEWLVTESRIPRVGTTTLDDFIQRSANKDYSIRRYKNELSGVQIESMKSQMNSGMGTFYHFGFDYDSRRQFCSKFVYDVYRQGAGVEIGRVETFRELLSKNEGYPLTFWKLWFFGFIPWERRTVSPGSQYLCDNFTTVYEKLSEYI